ncbi:hypothetical protein [Peribacillus sp. SCS-155]|uniref:hypothetical protein n=1 Tax=Peribacillus sedimenti TaxID=3115297 RepID=UPI003905B6EF
MTTKLQQLFCEVLSKTEKILEATEPYNHPLLTLVRSSLEEQEEALRKLIPELNEENNAKLSEIREYISIVYHDHELANPTFRSWKRANVWMKLPSENIVNELELLFPEMKKNLEEAAMELEKIYGKEDVKFVVPTFYIPTLR